MNIKCILALVLWHFVNSSRSDQVIDCKYINDDPKWVKLICEERSFSSEHRCYSSLFQSFQRGVNQRNVKSIQTANCRQNHFDLAIFENFTELQDFDFASFGVDSYPDALNMINLRRFNGSYNNIAKIDGLNFRNIPNIIEMDLSFNHISFLDKSTFLELSELKVVNLSNNFIQTIDDGTFENNIHLKELRLDNNPMKRIDQVIFGLVMKSIKVSVSCDFVNELDTSSLKKLLRFELNRENAIFRLSTNRQFELNCKNEQFQSFRYFNISGNKLQDASKVIDLLGTSIEILDASDNYIDILNISLFKRWTNLKVLELKRTLLFHLDFSIFQLQRNLQVLDLSFNSLRKVDVSETFQLANLQTLILESNTLKDVDNIKPSYFPKLSYLNILKNKIPCSYLAKFTQQTKQFNRLNVKANDEHNQCQIDVETTTNRKLTTNKIETSQRQSKTIKGKEFQNHPQLTTRRIRNSSRAIKNSLELTIVTTPKNAYINSSKGTKSQKRDRNRTVNTGNNTKTTEKYLIQSKTMAVLKPTRTNNLSENTDLAGVTVSNMCPNVTETSEGQLIKSETTNRTKTAQMIFIATTDAEDTDLNSPKFDYDDTESTEISPANLETASTVASTPNDTTEGLEFHNEGQSTIESLLEKSATTENYSIESTADTSEYIQINSTKTVTDIQFSQSFSGEFNTVYHSESSIQTTTIMKYTQNLHQNWTTKTNRYFNFSISSMAAPTYHKSKSNDWKYFTILWIIICCIGLVIKSKWARTIGTRLIRGKPIHVPYRLDQQESYLRSVELIHHLDFKQFNRNIKKY